MLVLKCCFIGPCWPSTSCQLTLKCKRKTAKLLMSIRIAAFEYLNMCARYVRMFCKSLNINSRTRRRPDTRATHTHTHTHSHRTHTLTCTYTQTVKLTVYWPTAFGAVVSAGVAVAVAVAVAVGVGGFNELDHTVRHLIYGRILPTFTWVCMCVCVWLCVYAYCALFHFHSSNKTSKQTQRNCNRESSINRN